MVVNAMSVHVYLLYCCGSICLLLAAFVGLMDFQSVRQKKALLRFEAVSGLAMIADGMSYRFDGNTQGKGMVLLHIATLLGFVFLYLALYFFNSYLLESFMSTGRFHRVPRRLLSVFVISMVGITMVVLDLIPKLIYYFDSEGHYHRGPVFTLAILIPIICILTQLGFVLEYRERLKKRVFTIILTAMLLPLFASIAMIALEGFVYLDLSLGLSAVFLFAITLSEQSRSLVKAANTETVTGLPNTYGFIHEVDRMADSGEITKYNAYYFDIVRMSRYNAKYGKDTGDTIIINYAKYLREHVQPDEIIGRLGGNYFVGLIKKENTDSFLKMLAGVPVQVKVGNAIETIFVAAVAGGYKIETKSISGGQLLGHIATAVNYAKNVAKKPCVFMDQTLEDAIREKRQLEQTLCVALEQKEFFPYYQPKVDMKTNRLCGAEALVRWVHDGEMVAPMTYIPLMEQNATVCQLDFYMLDCVCRDMKTWIECGMNPPRVSVNFSRKNLGNPILAEEIARTIKKYDIPTNMIQIEVTETLDEFPMDYLVGVVKALQRYGCSVAIDDFGTGSSSIGLLKEVAFDVLKIDRAFIDYHGEKEKSLLSYIIQMADAIGISVIAEGVERKEQMEVLREMGCHEIQGFIFDRPLRKEDYEARILNPLYKEPDSE